MSDKSLDYLFKKYGSDNSYLGYTEYLEPYCKKLKFQNFDLLEIGIGGHNVSLPKVGLNAWEEYFEKAKIYGIDLNDKSNYENKRIKTIKGSQSSNQVLNKIKKLTNNLKIVFDDGSHIPDHQIFTFMKLFPHMKEGGFYAITDIEYSYSNTYASININNKKNVLNFFKNLIHFVNSDIIFDNYLKDKNIFDTIKSIQFHHGLIIIEKGKYKPKQTKYLKLLQFNKKQHDLSQKKKNKGNIKFKKLSPKNYIYFQNTHDSTKNHNLFIPEETSFIESEKNRSLGVKFMFKKKIKVKFYKIYPSIFTPLRAPSKWTFKIFDKKRLIEKGQIKLNKFLDEKKFYKFKTSRYIDEIVFNFTDNFTSLVEKKESSFEKLKRIIKRNLKKNLNIKKNKSNKIIRINKIYFFDENKKNILEKEISTNFIKNLKIKIKNLTI